MQDAKIVINKRVSDQSPLLTIAIPTFNRFDLLRGLLDQIDEILCTHSLAGRLEVLVSDNASSDSTSACIEAFANRPHVFNFKVQRHAQNVGMDLNFLSLFCGSAGKYCWLMSDDDRFIKEGVYELLEFLQKPNPPDFVLINQVSLGGDGSRYFNWSNHVVDGLDGFLRAVTSYLTFVGIVAFRRDKLDFSVYEKYNSTFLLLSYVFCDAVKVSPRGVAMEQPSIRYKLDNTGGYALFRVFCDEFSSVLSYARRKGASTSTIRFVIYKHTRFFLVGATDLYWRKRKSHSGNFRGESLFCVSARVISFVKSSPLAWASLIRFLIKLWFPFRR